MRDLIGFLAGAMVVGGGVWLWMDHEATQSFMRYAVGDGVKAQVRAMQAYQHEEPSVAIWELRHLAELQSEHLRLGLDLPRRLQTGLFLTHGRLAKLYDKIGDTTNAQKHADLSIDAFRQAYPTNATATNFTTALEWIEKFDDRANKEVRYE